MQQKCIFLVLSQLDMKTAVGILGFFFPFGTVDIGGLKSLKKSQSLREEDAQSRFDATTGSLSN